MGITERKEREKQEMRRLILNTARRLFVEEGFEKINMRRIAEEIEYSPATLYLYFKDKDEILYALHTEGFEMLYQRQQTLLAIPDPLERLRLHARIYITFALEHPEYYDLMFIMRSPTRKIEADHSWGVGLRSYQVLKENISACIEAGLLKGARLETASFAIWSLVHGAASLYIRGRCVILPQEHLEGLLNDAVTFILDSISKP